MFARPIPHRQERIMRATVRKVGAGIAHAFN